jgi:hypothetical protein
VKKLTSSFVTLLTSPRKTHDQVTGDREGSRLGPL